MGRANERKKGARTRRHHHFITYFEQFERSRLPRSQERRTGLSETMNQPIYLSLARMIIPGSREVIIPEVFTFHLSLTRYFDISMDLQEIEDRPLQGGDQS